jgi:hypothetical protein
MTLVIFDGNTKNYTILNKKEDDLKVELIKVQNDENNNESSIIKQTKPKKPRKIKPKLSKKNKEFLNLLTDDLANNVKLSRESQDFLNTLKA